MLNLEQINKKIKDAVKNTLITDTDQLNEIVNNLFPSDDDLKSTIEHLQTLKTFKMKSHEFVIEMVKSKVRDAMMYEAYTVYQTLNTKKYFTKEEIEEELNNYIDDYEDDNYEV